MNKIKIIGIGPGHRDYILPAAYQAIEGCDLVIGAKRHLELFSEYRKETYCYGADLEALVEKIRLEYQRKSIAVLVSGDPGFYSLLDFLRDRLQGENFEVIPGISSFQYFFSALGRSYKEYELLSIHGREVDFMHHLSKSKGLFLLTDKKNSPARIARKLIDLGYEGCKMAVGENLSYENERIEEGKVMDFTKKEFSNLCVVVIEHEG